MKKPLIERLGAWMLKMNRTTTQVAAELGYSESAVRTWFKRGRLPQRAEAAVVRLLDGDAK